MKNEIILIGDAPEDIQIGQSLGIKTVGITGGYYSSARVKAAKPDYLIHRLEDLRRILR
ncbi:MAG: hypothetical protein COT81_00935 [Candidatus Buchananbacteria bacterium CG10_big_fil_rev_8_21_14_0_10_42_9]|uniref:HAD family hydrolase n=1 Tax=Candidatus Buchananbacteria bacterium CG10_big_fil_rev_8_21_14_0_10_42_9 TaxID=1974526 RepID=A0A2H0W2B9_9BACT|nr:MAG: hypothetical protein COT81_00935 [Candidatus Buchananbacteria bacterium CG10_big_fil_rev_8_21_14_0_10_42_9]